MTRELYAGTLVQLPNGAPAPKTPVTLWNDLTAGNDITAQVVGLDGFSPYTAETDNQGMLAHLRGPDGYTDDGIYADTGIGQRFKLTSATAFLRLYNQVAQLSVGGGGVGGVADWDTLVDKPDTFPPSAHQHPAGQISDATTVGQAVMKAADAQAARVAIGAGTGNGTSNLTLGTGAGTAAFGNHSHTASAVGFTPAGAITAQDVQTAIVQASNTGGTSGASQVLVWRYASGAYPALPTTKPSGVYEVRALGPTYPTTIPSWIGLGATQIPLSYSKVALT